MATSFQCTLCREVIEVDERLVGRSVLCLLCGSTTKVPKPIPGQVFPAPDLAEQLRHFKLSEWDRAVATTTLTYGLVPPAALRKAIYAVRLTSHKGDTVPLNEQLCADGALDARANLALADLVKGLVSEMGKKEELRECPNCFATIRTGEANCSFCGQALANLVRWDMCPKCKRRQPAGKEWCHHCHANLHTGLLPSSQLLCCPSCGTAVVGTPKTCPSCKASLGRAIWIRSLREPIRLLRFPLRFLWESFLDLRLAQRIRVIFGLVLLALLLLALGKAVPLLQARAALLKATEEVAAGAQGRSPEDIARQLRTRAHTLGFLDTEKQPDAFRVRTFDVGGVSQCTIDIDLRHGVSFYGLARVPYRLRATVSKAAVMDRPPKSAKESAVP